MIGIIICRTLSNHRYSRAQRSLGKYWFLRRDLEKAADAYEQALKINPMFENSWFTLGMILFNSLFNIFEVAGLSFLIWLESYYFHRSLIHFFIFIFFFKGVCQMNLKRFDAALQSFSRVVSISNDSGEAWANLAAIHCQKEGWSEAMLCISEAVKRSRENWRVWDNYIKIAVKVNDYGT